MKHTTTDAGKQAKPPAPERSTGTRARTCLCRRARTPRARATARISDGTHVRVELRAEARVGNQVRMETCAWKRAHARAVRVWKRAHGNVRMRVQSASGNVRMETCACACSR